MSNVEYLIYYIVIVLFSFILYNFDIAIIYFLIQIV